MQRSLKGRRRSSSHDRRAGTNGLPINGLVTQSERDLTKVTKVSLKNNEKRRAGTRRQAPAGPKAPTGA